MRAAGLGVTVIDGEDRAAGEDELLHATTIRTMARAEALIGWLNAGLGRQLRIGWSELVSVRLSRRLKPGVRDSEPEQ
jgi:hypothetical protein